MSELCTPEKTVQVQLSPEVTSFFWFRNLRRYSRQIFPTNAVLKWVEGFQSVFDQERRYACTYAAFTKILKLANK